MSHDTSLHVKIDKDTAEGLDYLALARKKSKAELVREALATCYQTACAGLSTRQERALAAYQGGYISLGKLADTMGMQALELRGWLREHDIAENNGYSEEDTARA